MGIYPKGSGGSGGSSTDEKVKVDSSDIQAGYLEDKLMAGDNITITEEQTEGNKRLRISAEGGGGSSDEKVKVDSSDIQAGYLEDKFVAGDNITITEEQTEGNKRLRISAEGGGGSSVNYKQGLSEIFTLAKTSNCYSSIIYVSSSVLPSISKIKLITSETGSITKKLYSESGNDIGEYLRAFYKFEQDYVDTRRLQGNLIPVNSPSFVQGQVGYALSVNETNGSYAYLPSSQQNDNYNLCMENTSFSIGCWVYIPDYIGHNAFILSRERTSPTRDGYNLLWESFARYFMLEFYRNGSRVSVGYWVEAFETWYHLVAVVDKENSKIKFYVNGTKVDETDNYEYYPYFGDDFYVGNSKYWNGHNFTGYIDEAFVIKKALTDDEVADIYQNGLSYNLQLLTTLVNGENSVDITNSSEKYILGFEGSNFKLKGYLIEFA